ncbi:MAG: DUF5702 domain-containing protein [Lachnospiraceae bacterium]|nr:DUF5702 domain-containing protein [Lachnospiraceae bacterium]
MREKGAITVFLSFTFLLITSLIMVLLEGARMRAAATIADMQLTTCVESLLGEFYRPLYEKYGVFGIDTAFGGKVPDMEELTNVFKGFLGESSFGLTPEEGKITATRPFVTKDGKTFLKQVEEYEKYCAAIDTLGPLLERIGILSKENEVYKIYERQMEIEDSLAMIDRNTLILMDKIDGLVCNGSTIGEVHELFVKSFMTRGIDPVSAGINNTDVWMLLEDRYFNPEIYVDNAVQKIKMAIPEVERRDELKKQLSDLLENRRVLSDDISAKRENLNILIEKNTADEDGEKGKDNKKGEPAEITDLRAEIDKLLESADETDADIRELSQEVNDLNESINDLVLSATAHTDELMRKVSGCLLEAKEAVEIIEEDREIANNARPMIEMFEKLLENSRDILSKESYSAFRVSLSRMRRYTGMDGKMPDFEIMEDTLRKDVSVLSSIEREANISTDVSRAAVSEVSLTNLLGWNEKMNGVRNSIAEFSYDKLVFDYSEMKPDRILCELSDGLKRTVAKGFLGLLVDEDKLSEKRLDVRNRPSDLSEAEPEGFRDAGDILTDELGKESGAESFCGVDAANMMSEVGRNIEEKEPGFAEKMLLLLYIREHFGDNIDRVTSSQGALAYEQEYILFGGRSDVENLAEMATMIMLVRMVTSGAYVMSNTALHMRAAEIASSMVGFTGLYFLTAIVKYMILFVWSAEQAIVETAAIIAGKKVPIITTSSSYCIDSFDPAALTHEGIKSKVKTFRESEVSLVYGDYLFIFMITVPGEELCLRTMDLIEENMRWGYDESFLLENCITGFDANLVFSCPSRYISIFDGLFTDIQTPSGYGFVRSDSVNY